MNDDDLLQELGRVLNVLQRIKDALTRRRVSRSSVKTRVFRDAATDYALANASSVVTGATTREFIRKPSIHSSNDYQFKNEEWRTIEQIDEPMGIKGRNDNVVMGRQPRGEHYPVSDRVEEIIKSMPPLKRDPKRDSLASIQNPLSPDGYPPVKALVGVFTWTHDISFATKILGLLSTEEERAGLLSEAVEYYKLHHLDDGEDMSFFNEWIWRDLLALVYDGTISFETASKLREQANRDSSKTLTFVRPDQSRRM